jgi:hypothetical protein
MSTLAHVVQQLKKARSGAADNRRIGQRFESLSGLDGLRGKIGSVGRAQIPGRKRRTMSAAVRKRIAAAQRARWAKWKAANRKK